MISEEVKKLIGQVVCIGFDGPVYTEELDEMISKYYCGNIILFSRNYTDPEQLLKLNKKLHSRIKEITGKTALITIDQEGGCVTRLMNGVTFPAGALTTAESSYPDAAHITGEHIGYDMIRLGLNVNLAPVLDINPSDDPYYSNIRHYSTDPKVVAKLGHDFIAGLKEYGVLGCAKHFPGAGDDKVDTHFGMSLQEKGVEELLSHDLYPFMENLDVPCMMTTHTIFKQVEELPSTLSYNVVTGILRNRMHYNGIVISDALEMDAINKYFGAVNASLMSLNAGVDMILCCHSRDIQIETLEYLYKAVEEGKLKISDLEEKVARLSKYKDYSSLYLEKYFNNEDSYTCDTSHNEIQQEIVDKSIKVIYGNVPTITKNTLLIAPEAVSINGAEDVFSERSLPNRLRKEFDCDVITLDDSTECKNQIFKDISKYDKVVLFTYNVNYRPYQCEYANEISKTKDLYVISLKWRMDERLYTNLKNYTVICEYTPQSVNTIIKFLKYEL